MGSRLVTERSREVAVDVGDRMTITRVDGERGTLLVSGEVDAYSSPMFERALDVTDHCERRVDMSAVTFMDSTGLRALVRADDVARRADRVLSVVAPSDVVTRLLQLTALHDRLNVTSADDRAPDGLRRTD